MRLKGNPPKRKHSYCPNLFRPLNDGDTSLVEGEEFVTAQGAVIRPVKELAK